MPSRSKDRVGVVGLGIMGSAMSKNLLGAGFDVVGFDVLAERTAEHRKAGGTTAVNARDVARRADTIVTSLPSVQALSDTIAAIAPAARTDHIVIETSTLSISAKEDARQRLAARGATLLDCPLSGTGAQARVKDLVVYASGDRRAYQRSVHVIDGFARARYFVGPFGSGSKMKFVANLLVAIHNVAAAEALVLARKAGLDPAMVLEAVTDGAGNSRMLQVRGPMMVNRSYSDATMKLGIWQKDMTLIEEFARACQCPTPLFAASAPIYLAALADSRAAEDTAAVHAVLEAMAKTTRDSKASRRGRRPNGRS